MAEIKKIQVGSTAYDIAAKYILSNDTTPTLKSWGDILELIEAGTDLVYLNSLPTANKTAYDTYKNDIVIVPAATTATSNACDEYIITRNGIEGSYTYAWEKIGTTEADLANYQKIGKTLTSSGPSTNTTGEASGYTATVSGTVKYDKSNANTGNDGGFTIDGANFSFGGTAATITLSTDYTPAGSITGSQSVSAHSHTVNAATATAVTGVKATGGTANAITGLTTSSTAFVTSYDGSTKYLKTGSVTGVSGSTTASKATAGTAIAVAKKASSATTVGNANVGTSITVPNVSSVSNVTASYAEVSNDVLILTAVTPTKTTLGTAFTFNPAVTSTATIYGVGDTVNITPYTFTDVTVPKAATSASTFVNGLTTTVAEGMGVLVGLGTANTASALTSVDSSGTATVIKSDGLATSTFVTSATLSTAGAVTINGSNFGFSGTSATIEVEGSYTPAGSITGKQTVSAHSHTIGTTETNATVSLGAAITAHTHTMGNHTHSVTTSNS